MGDTLAHGTLLLARQTPILLAHRPTRFLRASRAQILISVANSDPVMKLEKTNQSTRNCWNSPSTNLRNLAP